MGELAIAIASFVGSHELLSHPLRRPLIAKLGERGFLGLYSVVALATLIWTVRAYRDAPQVLLWVAPGWMWDLGRAIMIVASILFVGSLVAPNPALTGAGGVLAKVDGPRGVMRITRHPMMWGFALWALVHATLSGTEATLILAAGIALLALGGARMQDLKKRKQLGDAWRAHERKTSFFPFGAQLSRRQPIRTLWPGWTAIVAGLIFYFGATWAHPVLFDAPPIGVWNLL